jgi:hypothetical protein
MAQRSEPTDGAESYPFDPSVRAEHERDLDRLRGFADRQLAAHLFDLYVLAANNSAKPLTAAKVGAGSTEVVRVLATRALATRALAGQLGSEARDLAEALLLDPTGRERVDDPTLRAFAHAYRELKRG